MRVLTAILLGGLIAGAFDISYAIATYYFAFDVPPIRIFQSVAGGWVGREAARAGGMDTAILGGVTHFTFTTMTVRGVFYTFSGKFLKGGVYGAGDLDDQTPVLEGTLTRFRDGKKVAAANLKFVYFGGT